MGAIGLDWETFAQVASRGAAGLVKSGKNINAKNNTFVTQRSYALAA